MASRILLADDSITIQKVVNLTFADEGIEVVAVSNGEQAEKRLGEIKPDLVLADIFMPGKNGYELCDVIKKSPEFRDIPVILLVGAFEPFNQEEARRVHADAHLTKPFESRTLVETVRGLITSRAKTTTAPLASPPPPNALSSAAPAQSATRVEREPQPAGEKKNIVLPAFNLDLAAMGVSATSAEPAGPAKSSAVGTLDAPADEAFPLDIDYGAMPGTQALDAAEIQFDTQVSFHGTEFSFDAPTQTLGSEPALTVVEQPDFEQVNFGETDAELSLASADATPANSFELAGSTLIDFEAVSAPEQNSFAPGMMPGAEPAYDLTGDVLDDPYERETRRLDSPNPTGSIQNGRPTDDLNMATSELGSPAGSDAETFDRAYEASESAFFTADDPLGDVLSGAAPAAGEEYALQGENISEMPANGQAYEETAPEAASASWGMENAWQAANEQDMALPSDSTAGGQSDFAVLSTDEYAAGTGFDFKDVSAPEPDSTTGEQVAFSGPEEVAEGFTASGMWTTEPGQFAAIDIEATPVDDYEGEATVSSTDQEAETGFAFSPTVSAEPAAKEPAQVSTPGVQDHAAGLSPEMIEEIVRRVVAQMSEQVVREIAWEVVPDCVERVVANLTREALSKKG